jgi:hypothetical protein
VRRRTRSDARDPSGRPDVVPRVLRERARRVSARRLLNVGLLNVGLSLRASPPVDDAEGRRLTL